LGIVPEIETKRPGCPGIRDKNPFRGHFVPEIETKIFFVPESGTDLFAKKGKGAGNLWGAHKM
jgi:hypothetical protein